MSRNTDEPENPLLDKALEAIKRMGEWTDDRPWSDRAETAEDRRERRIRIIVPDRGEVVEDFVPENRLRLHHAQLRDALMLTLGIKPEGRDAFNARMKNILNLGLFGSGIEIVDGRREYRLVDALEFAVAIMLQRAYVPQTVTVDFVIDHRDTLDRHWEMLRLGRRPPFWFALSMEGLLPTGDENRSRKRGNRGGRQLDTVKLVPGKRIRPGAALAPSVVIDLPDLVETLDTNLVDVGVDAATVKEARLALPGRRLGYMGHRAVEWERELAENQTAVVADEHLDHDGQDERGD